MGISLHIEPATRFDSARVEKVRAILTDARDETAGSNVKDARALVRRALAGEYHNGTRLAANVLEDGTVFTSDGANGVKDLGTWSAIETVEYLGTDLVPGMTLRLDGRDWNIAYVFPYAVLDYEKGNNPDGSLFIGRDFQKSVIHLETFIRHQGQHHVAYVIDNSDPFQVVL